jgi:hypothetical protein
MRWLTKEFLVLSVTSYKADNEYNLDGKIKRYVLVYARHRNFLIDNVAQFIGLRKIIKKEKPDTIVSFMAEPNIRMLVSTIGIDCKKIISVRNDPVREYPNFIYRLLAKKFLD